MSGSREIDSTSKSLTREKKKDKLNACNEDMHI